MKTEESSNLNNTKLTDDMLDLINKEMEEFANSDPNLKFIKNLPSNNGVETSDGSETGEYVHMNVMTNPATGEQVLLNEVEDNYNKDMSALVETINSGKDIFNYNTPYTKDELKTALKSLYMISDNIDTDIIVDEHGDKLLLYAQKEIDNSIENYYKELPDCIKPSVDKLVNIQIHDYPSFQQTPQSLIYLRKLISKSFAYELVKNMKFERSKHDFAKELQLIYETSGRKISNKHNEYVEARNKSYREAVNNIEDEKKRKELTDILDSVDEAKNLTKLKEFSSKIKLKKIEIQKYRREFDHFLHKYKYSSNNIYSIDLALQFLERNLKVYNYTDLDAIIFLVEFTKQVRNYNIDIATEHAYIFYVLYNCVSLDTANENKEFINNVIEVIDNAKKRNNYLP